MRLNPNALRALGLVLATVVLLSLVGWGWQRWQQHRNSRAIERPAAAHAATVAARPAQQHANDSVYFTRAGQALEASARAAISQHQYDSLRRLFPAAVPVLPAQPARYRPAR